MLSRSINLIARARRAGSRRRRLLVEAAAALARAQLGLKLLPFRRAVRLGAVPLAKPELARVNVEEAVDAVRRVAAAVPWRSVCFDQGIALQRMLRRRGIDARLHYGIASRAANPLSAHVWVSVGSRAVIGGDEAPNFAEVAAFP